MSGVLTGVRAPAVAFSTSNVMQFPTQVGKVGRPKKTAAENKLKGTRTRLTSEEKEAMPPKRPAHKFIRFFSEQAAKAGGGGPKLGPLAKELSVVWRNMTEEQKAKYDTPLEERQEYQRKLFEWSEKVDPKLLVSINKVRDAQHRYKVVQLKEHAMKAPATPYMYFVKDFWAKHIPADATAEERDFVNVSKRSSEAWRLLSQEEKQVYYDIASKKREEYKKYQEDNK
ncbi:hypothetical protein FA15DRAFT_708842 [Coprinopsis marcescibilis]|uniref:HMG box domain-containing protein n=1 Tax=Coprinopsis marcescibilis TaxID=230819 RepID=A0A5C3KHU1_COPMA|nr:hypothetical protein FA15DRAFT_708842 [Coprinopsis marcescibilis]